jgi:hypothetical protein
MPNKKVKNCNKKTNTIYKNQYFVYLPTEIILEILKFLHPKVLLLLLQVNKRLNQILSEKSNTILQLWKKSRIFFLEKRILDPPKKLNEREYVQFLLNEKCNSCKKKYTICSWKSLTKYCKKYADEKNKNVIGLYFENYKYNIKNEILKRKDVFAWEEQLKEIKELSKTIKFLVDINYIIHYKIKNKYKDLYEYINQREEEDKIYEKYKIVLRKIEINKKIDEMCLEKDENNNYKYQKYYLQECKSLLLAYKYKTEFNEKSWKTLKEKITIEYYEIIERFKIKPDDKNNRLIQLKAINNNYKILQDIYQAYTNDYEEYKNCLLELRLIKIKYIFDVYSPLFRYYDFIFPTIFNNNLLSLYSTIIESQYNKINRFSL